MLALSLVFVVLGLRVGEALGAAVQVPLSMGDKEIGGGAVAATGTALDSVDVISKPRKLHGRFLHITDIHPDGHYKAHAAESKACHRKLKKKNGKKGKNISGYYGTSFSECDSSFRLSNFTLDFLDENWADEIDFVVWTGDSARHDNDHQLPRTPDEIFMLNRAVTAKMESVFTRRGVPVVPSLGNNDIWPHNIMSPGPNRVTNEFSSIWQSFIPFPYRQVFQRGAYYAKEVVPNELAIISLNTLYFYDSNKVVGGCPYGDPDDPGNLELDWLEVQLKEYMDRGMQVWVTGHVPPSPGNYFPECFVRYAELALRFQNVIVGHLFGHMNIDHFFFLESIDLDIIPDEYRESLAVQKKEIHATGNDLALYDTLLAEFSALPTPKRTNLDEYAVVNVAPSVVPNYRPSFRIYSYNVTETGAHDEPATTLDGGRKKPAPKKPPKRHHGRRRGDKGAKDKHCKEEEYNKSWKCHLDEPWNSDEESPSRRNQFWTPLGYAQYVMPNLDEANKTHAPVFELEYVTFSVEKLREEEGQGLVIPARHLPESLFTGNETKSKFAPYGLEDLTIGSWVQLARRVADTKRVKLRKRFKKYMFSGGY